MVLLTLQKLSAFASNDKIICITNQIHFGIHINSVLVVLAEPFVQHEFQTSRTILAIVGEMLPPWRSRCVGNNFPVSMYPHFRNLCNISLSMGMCFSIQSWLMLSKQPFISPSSTHCARSLRANIAAHCTAASCCIVPCGSHRNWDLLWFQRQASVRICIESVLPCQSSSGCRAVSISRWVYGDTPFSAAGGRYPMPFQGRNRFPLLFLGSSKGFCQRRVFSCLGSLLPALLPVLWHKTSGSASIAEAFTLLCRPSF